jgi:hypothetical protein
MTQKPVDCRLTHFHPVFRQILLNFQQCNIWLLIHQLVHAASMRVKNMLLVAAKLIRANATGFAFAANQSAHRTQAQTEKLGNRFASMPGLNRRHHALPQIFGIGLAHHAGPLTSANLESDSP